MTTPVVRSRQAPTPVVSPLGLGRSLLLIGAVLLAVALLVGLAVLAAVLLPAARAHALALVAWLLPVHALVVLAVIALLLRRWGTSFRALGFRTPTLRMLHLLWQIPAVLLAAVVTQAVVTALLGTRPPAENTTVALLAGRGAAGLVPVAAVGLVLLVPVWEEAVFRGVIRGGLRRRFPAPVAVLVSAAVFAAAHGVPVLIPYLFVGGVGFALIVDFHRTLWASVVAHATMNALAVAAALAVATGGP